MTLERYVESVREFRKAFELAIGDEIDYQEAMLDIRLVSEELAETIRAIQMGDMVEIADGLADLMYVICQAPASTGDDYSSSEISTDGLGMLGSVEFMIASVSDYMEDLISNPGVDPVFTALAAESVIECAEAYGIPFDEIFDIVHASNMSKLKDGKPLKDEGGKIMKGPDFWSPTEKITAVLKREGLV